MNINDEQIRADWTKALGVDELKDDPEALTINQLRDLLGKSRTFAERWAERAAREGRIKAVKVYRIAGQGGSRWQQAYKLIESED